MKDYKQSATPDATSRWLRFRVKLLGALFMALLLVAFGRGDAARELVAFIPDCGLLVKRLLGELEAGQPGLKQQMLAALSNVKPAHLLDPTLLVGLQPAARDGKVQAHPQFNRAG